MLMRWNSSCPPERVNDRYPSSSSTIRSSRDSCAARVPPLPIRVSSSRRVTTFSYPQLQKKAADLPHHMGEHFPYLFIHSSFRLSLTAADETAAPEPEA